MIEFPWLLLLILVFIQWTLKCYQILYFVYVYCLSTVLFSLPSSSVHHNAFMIFHKIKASFMIDPFISRVVSLLYSAFRQQHSQCICKRQCCCFDLLLIGGKYGISAAVRHEWTMGLCARTTLGMIAVVVVAVLSKTPRSRCSKTYRSRGRPDKYAYLEDFIFGSTTTSFWYEYHQDSLKFISVESADICICETKDMT